ncbi:hypothetical protein B0T25DRAFT_96087 [Lasiosphaeria hispida]|uniref:Uncharacterized protein n=1 Tax=Lasiosphaeria hispida TaxID=260671 RepID=A0AAJ0HQ84_9PEZI|nr:hypothetical protein B0T25DRAFT_96087 [Lasiosphaeria hispida]
MCRFKYSPGVNNPRPRRSDSRSRMGSMRWAASFLPLEHRGLCICRDGRGSFGLGTTLGTSLGFLKGVQVVACAFERSYAALGWDREDGQRSTHPRTIPSVKGWVSDTCFWGGGGGGQYGASVARYQMTSRRRTLWSGTHNHLAATECEGGGCSKTLEP